MAYNEQNASSKRLKLGMAPYRSQSESQDETDTTPKTPAASPASPLATLSNAAAALAASSNRLSPWGTLLFFENQKMIVSRHLSGDDPIDITGALLAAWRRQACDTDTEGREAEPAAETVEAVNSLENLTSWEVTIGDGFALRHTSADSVYGASLVLMRNLGKVIDPTVANMYKAIKNNDSYPDAPSVEFDITVRGGRDWKEIYKAERDGIIRPGCLAGIQDLHKAHREANACYLLIVVLGSFIAVTPFVSLQTVTREVATLMPYYFVLKINDQYDALDRHMLQLLARRHN